jgi:hypothetical protein
MPIKTPIKTIPLSRLEADLHKTLNECADSGSTVVVQLPDERLVAIHPLDPAGDDDLINELIESNGAFRALVEKSRSSARKPFSARQAG